MNDQADKLEVTKKKTRTVRNFPASTFDEALDFAKRIHEISGSQPVRRITLFDQLGKSPESSSSRQAVTNASKYGLTKGGTQAETIELTPAGFKAVGDGVQVREKARARIDCAILDIPPFKAVFDMFVGNKLPARAVLVDAMKANEVQADAAEEATDTFIVNLRTVGLLRTLSGAERIVSVDMALDELPSSAIEVGPVFVQHPAKESFEPVATPMPVITSGQAGFETTAFYVSPIGALGSIERKHADMFAASIVEPALEQSKLKLIRADQIESPGLITRQVLEYLLRSRLVIVDLSFRNPNVFYELAIRHILRKPTVQIIRAEDKIPFDISQSRTIVIDESDKYDFVPKIGTYIAMVSAQVRQALENPDAVDNPISVYFPQLTASVANQT